MVAVLIIKTFQKDWEEVADTNMVRKMKNQANLFQSNRISLQKLMAIKFSYMIYLKEFKITLKDIH